MSNIVTVIIALLLTAISVLGASEELPETNVQSASQDVENPYKVDHTPLNDEEISIILEHSLYSTSVPVLIGRFPCGAVFYDYDDSYQQYNRQELIGPALFCLGTWEGVRILKGNDITFLSAAYRSGMVSDEEVVAIHICAYQDHPEKGKLYRTSGAVEKIRALLSQENVQAVLVQDGESGGQESISVQLSGSEDWDPEDAVALIEDEISLMEVPRAYALGRNDLTLTSPDLQGTAVHISFTRFDGDGAVFLETPEGTVTLRGRSVNQLYAYIRRHYNEMLRRTGQETAPEKIPDLQVITDFDGDGIDETVSVYAEETTARVSVVSIDGTERMGFLRDMAAVTEGMWMITHTEEGVFLLEDRMAVQEDYKQEALSLAVYEPMAHGYEQYSQGAHAYWQICAGHLYADAASFEGYITRSEQLLENAELLVAVIEGKVVLGNEENAPSPKELFKGLQLFYDRFYDVDPGISDETVPLSERLDELAERMLDDYRETQDVYHVKSAYGEIEAIIQDDFSFSGRDYISLGILPWLEADLTEGNPFVIRRTAAGSDEPLPEILGYGGYEIDAVSQRGVHLQGDYSYPDRIRSWPDAVYGERYLVRCIDSDTDRYIVFGVVSREGAAFVQTILDACNSRFGTDYLYTGEYSGPNIHFYGKYDGLYAFRLTNVPEDLTIAFETAAGYRFIYPSGQRLLLYRDGQIFTLGEGMASEEIAPILQAHIAELYEAYYGTYAACTLGKDPENTAAQGLSRMFAVLLQGGAFSLSFSESVDGILSGAQGDVAAVSGRTDTDWSGYRLYQYLIHETELDIPDVRESFGEDSVIRVTREGSPYSCYIFPDRTAAVLKQDKETEENGYGVFISKSDVFPWLFGIMTEEAVSMEQHPET